MFRFPRGSFACACLIRGAVVAVAITAWAPSFPTAAHGAAPAETPAGETAATKPASQVSAPAAAAAAKPLAVYPLVNMAGFSREYRAIPIKSTKADEAIRATLRTPMRELVDFEETPLRAVIDEFRDSTGLPIVCDMQAFTDAGIDVEATTVTQALARLPGVSVAAALRLALHDTGLTWFVRDEVLTVTTREKAQENLMVVAYPLPRGFGDSRPADFQSMIDLIQSTVAANTWNTVGGPGAIQPLESGGEPLLVVSQTGEIHEEVEDFLRRIHERLLAEFARGNPVLRAHHVADDKARESLRDSLAAMCNASLGDRGDADAVVTIVGDSLSVLSKSPEFHALAAQVIAAVDGVVRREPPGPQGMGVVNPFSFCWVAREVYGSGDPRWLVFRGWMVDDAPRWLRAVYAARGPDIADWLRGRPAAKAALRLLMDVVVEPRLAGAGDPTGVVVP